MGSERSECRPGPALAHAEQFDVENQRCIGRNHPSSPARAVAERRGDDESALAADLHSGDALIPTANHAASPQGEVKRLPAIKAGIELLAGAAIGILQPSGVMDADLLSGTGLRSGADDEILEFEAGVDLGVNPRSARRLFGTRRAKWARKGSAKKGNSQQYRHWDI